MVGLLNQLFWLLLLLLDAELLLHLLHLVLHDLPLGSEVWVHTSLGVELLHLGVKWVLQTGIELGTEFKC